MKLGTPDRLVGTLAPPAWEGCGREMPSGERMPEVRMAEGQSLTQGGSVACALLLTNL